ncbi:MAG: low specificity L-threonine aldolase [Calditrichaeota bacterium]|nr:low specificity L-threonine aldolase [Calditrichota bacterium]
MTQSTPRRGFASDNNAGVHPVIMEAIQKCNMGHVIGYGDDPYTQQAIKTFRRLFGLDTGVYFVYGGTGANVTGLQVMLKPYQAVLCAETAHIYVDECGAPEKFTGCKLIPVPTEDGKLRIEQLQPYLAMQGFEHHVQPAVISVSQPTEMGTVYTVDELIELSSFAKKHGMLLHIDGARIANAAAYLNLTFKEITRDAGADVLSFGGTKNGMMFGEAVLIFNPRLQNDFKYIRKQGMQLHSKMRFIAAQFEAYLQDDLWLANARHANKMAQLLAQKINEIDEIKITQKVESNGVFAVVPKRLIEPLRKEYFFYTWNESKNEVRWMTSFDTTEEDVENFAQTIRRILKNNLT